MLTSDKTFRTRGDLGIVGTGHRGIAFDIKWCYDALKFETTVRIALTFPDGQINTKNFSHGLDTDHDHYEALSFWTEEMIADWKSIPYALEEQ